MIDNISHCSKHPRYKGARAPRTTCPACWLVYIDSNKDKGLTFQDPEVAWGIVREVAIAQDLYHEGEYVPKSMRKKKDTEYKKALKKIRNKVWDSGADMVFYAAYETDDEGIPSDNLDQVCVQGRVKFLMQWEDPDTDEQVEEESEILENPTWMDACRYCNTQIKNNGYAIEEVFLEDVTVRERVDCNIDGKFKLVTFDMGTV